MKQVHIPSIPQVPTLLNPAALKSNDTFKKYFNQALNDVKHITKGKVEVDADMSTILGFISTVFTTGGSKQAKIAISKYLAKNGGTIKGINLLLLGQDAVRLGVLIGAYVYAFDQTYMQTSVIHSDRDLAIRFVGILKECTDTQTYEMTKLEQGINSLITGNFLKCNVIPRMFR